MARNDAVARPRFIVSLRLFRQALEMLRVYGCITDQHDLRLVVLAGLICFLACYTASNLMARARESDTVRSLGWLSSAAIVFGGGVWATHFVAMLAFQPGFAIGYDIGMTLISIGAA